jgi:hypothetical protein
LARPCPSTNSPNADEQRRVQRDIAERVLGHAIPGVEGIYDRHDWMDEKADALARLATHIEEIV